MPANRVAPDNQDVQAVTAPDKQDVQAVTAPDKQDVQVIVVVGRSGHGKSTVCNALMGEDHFTVGTKISSSVTAERVTDCGTLRVVDTPDVSDSSWTEEQKKAEVDRWKEQIATCPCIFLLVIKSDAPYTEEDFAAYRQVKQLWGDRQFVKGRLVVVFTFCNGQEVKEVGDRMMETSPQWMDKIFKVTGGRYMVFKGKTSGDFLDEVRMGDSSSDDEDGVKGGRGRRQGYSDYARKCAGCFDSVLKGLECILNFATCIMGFFG